MSPTATEAGKRAENSDFFENAIRVGLVSYGVQHLLIAWLALSLALGDKSGKTNSTGAMHQLAESGVGRASLFVVAFGFLALILWQGLEAAVGHTDKEGKKRLFTRATSAGKVVIYITLGITAFKIAIGAGTGGGKSTDGWTATLMKAPAGQLLVGLVGLAILAVGGALAYRGWKEKFRKKLDNAGNSGKDGQAYVLFGKVGYIAKGVSLAIVASLFLYAAITHDADKSGGLDVALQKLLQQPFGVVLLVAMALGIACYGLFCFAWARHLDR